MRLANLLFLVLGVALLFGVQSVFADATNSPTLPPLDPQDDFNPGLGIAAAIIIMVMIVVCMLLLGFGLVAGVVVCALAGALAAFGILSSSVAIALPFGEVLPRVSAPFSSS